MLSRNVEKLIKSLKVKKYRHNHHLYIAEGVKVVEEIISTNNTPKYLVVTNNAQTKFQNYQKDLIIVDEKKMKEISQLSTPSDVLGVFEIPQDEKFTLSDLTLILDNIGDPGNLGTIVRTADWFGIKNIVCSKESVDLYNIKTVQSTMGSINRVNVYYEDLAQFINKYKKEVTIYATTLDGDTLEKTKPEKPAFIIIGSESHGISDVVLSLTDKKITITKLGSAESLNAAVATSIVCYHFRLFGR
jgi:RNA methyltransferase, TrmH family